MKKFLRRLAIVFLMLGIGLIVAGLVVRSRVRAVPAWYRHLHLDDATQHMASASMRDKLLATYAQANDAVSAATRAKFPQAPVAPVELPPTAMTVELTEAEINSFFAEWDNREHWRARISKFVVDPLVILEDHELILAGTVPDWNMLVSLHFEPKLENGKLNLSLKQVMVGTLPLPRSAVEGYLTKIEGIVAQKMPEYRQKAEISPRGWANGDAVAAAMGELLSHSLHDEPAEPVLMLHELDKMGPDARSLPVIITAVEISDKTLKLTLRTMTPDEREALEQHLRGTETSQQVAVSPN